MQNQITFTSYVTQSKLRILSQGESISKDQKRIQSVILFHLNQRTHETITQADYIEFEELRRNYHAHLLMF